MTASNSDPVRQTTSGGTAGDHWSWILTQRFFFFLTGFYAPFLTSFITPTFFGFLVGPSYPNRRKDGQLGGAYLYHIL